MSKSMDMLGINFADLHSNLIDCLHGIRINLPNYTKIDRKKSTEFADKVKTLAKQLQTIQDTEFPAWYQRFRKLFTDLAGCLPHLKTLKDLNSNNNNNESDSDSDYEHDDEYYDTYHD